MALRDGFWNTTSGILLQLQRRRERVFQFGFKGELETKKSSKLVNSLAFQSKLRQSTAAQGRKTPFNRPVMLEMDFTPGLTSPAPAVHSLAKHYIDLLQWPADRGPTDRERLLLKDDRLVKGLICTYWLGIDHSEPGISMRVSTMANVVRDFEFCTRIIHGDIPGDVRADRLTKWHRDGWDADDEWGDDPVREYRDHVRREAENTRILSKKAYESQRLLLQQEVQTKFLKLVELGPDRLSDLLWAYSKKRKHRFDDLRSISAEQQRKLHSLVAIDLGPSAVREGESGSFKENVRKRLASCGPNKI